MQGSYLYRDENIKYYLFSANYILGSYLFLQAALCSYIEEAIWSHSIWATVILI